MKTASTIVLLTLALCITGCSSKKEKGSPCQRDEECKQNPIPLVCYSSFCAEMKSEGASCDNAGNRCKPGLGLLCWGGVCKDSCRTDPGCKLEGKCRAFSDADKHHNLEAIAMFNLACHPTKEIHFKESDACKNYGKCSLKVRVRGNECLK